MRTFRFNDLKWENRIMNVDCKRDSDKTVCVVVPVYNGAKTIRKCLLSILRQSYRDLLIAVVDDGSTDNSFGIISEIAREDPRVIPIHQTNQGAVSARNKGVAFARDKGIPYVCFCDADDKLPRSGIGLLTDAIFRSKSDLVCGNAKKCWKNIIIPSSFKPSVFRINAPVIYNRKDIREKIISSYFGISNFPVSVWAKLYKTSIIGQFADDRPVVRFYGEDLSLTIKIVLAADSLCIIPGTVYYYQMGGATSSFMPSMLDDFLSLYNYRQSIIEKNDLSKDSSAYMAAEAMNFLKTYFSKCLEYCPENRENRALFKETVKKTVSDNTFREAAETVLKRGWNNSMALPVSRGEVDEIVSLTEELVKADRRSIKGKMRRILNKLN